MNNDLISSFVTLSLFFTIAACNAQNTDTTLKVIGGTENDTIYPEAVAIFIKEIDGKFTVCTGTVVRDDLVLTAAHCIQDASTVTMGDYASHGMPKKVVKSQTFVSFPTYDPQAAMASQLRADVAFVVLPKGSFAGHAIGKIASSSPKKGDAVGLVGYGRTDETLKSSNSEFKRHAGANTVHDIALPLGSSIILTTTAVGMSTSAVGPGDSGGPLFNSAGEVVGIAAKVGGMWGPVGNKDISSNNAEFSYYVNVNDPGVAEFMNIVLSTPDPTASTAQSVKATPIDLTSPPWRPSVMSLVDD